MPEANLSAPMSQEETSKPVPDSPATSIPQVPSCIHQTSIRNYVRMIPLKPYKVYKGGVIVEEGLSCPKCHKLMVTFKKED